MVESPILENYGKAMGGQREYPYPGRYSKTSTEVFSRLTHLSDAGICILKAKHVSSNEETKRDETFVHMLPC